MELSEKKWTLKLNVNLLWRDTPIELDFNQIKTS
jgi:transcription antitermination factor NusG